MEYLIQEIIPALLTIYQRDTREGLLPRPNSRKLCDKPVPLLVGENL